MIFDDSSIWIIAISVGIIIIIMVSSFIAYVCGCFKKIPNRDELVGLSGVVKITNPDSEESTAPPIPISMTRTHSDDNVPMLNVLSSSISSKRLNGIGNNACNPGSATRSLPELPIDAAISGSSNRNDQINNNFIGYSGVGDTNSDLYATLEDHIVGMSVLPKSKIAPNGTLYNLTPRSSLAATYEQIDENPTYKVKGEHPYAQVLESDSGSPTYETERNSLERRNVAPVDEVDGPVNIPAASAISGSVAASNELPYMTPPVHAEHFSGDSQDSAKGYTSITVREPLAHIRPINITKQETSDSHYTVLSDDSDEMYAAIQEAYTSGSETYAQIQPLPSSNPTYCSVPETVNELNTSQKFGSSVHSRQASTSSVASSLTNRHSPKEKRQANSPLPKPPDLSADDMYAKVLKKRRNDDRCNSRDSVYNSDPDTASSLNFHPGALDVVEKKDDTCTSERGANIEVEDLDTYACGYNTLPERNYEILTEVNSSLGYETVKENFNPNSGYESLPEPDSLTPGYERIREPNGGYEKIKYSTKEDELDPNYEELKPQNNDEQFHCYATIDKKRKTSPEQLAEPDYASLRRANHAEYDNGMENDPFYERIQRQHSSQSRSSEGNEDEMNNNRCTNTSSKEDETIKHHSLSETNINDLYSKVNKTVKR